MSENLIIDVSDEEHEQAWKRLKMQHEVDDYIKSSVYKHDVATRMFLSCYSSKPKPNNDEPLQESAHAPIESTHRLDHISLTQDAPLIVPKKSSGLSVVFKFEIIKKLTSWVSSLFSGFFSKDEDKIESILRK